MHEVFTLCYVLMQDLSMSRLRAHPDPTGDASRSFLTGPSRWLIII